MPSSYTTSLRLTLPATGELSGTWGTTVNTGITELTDAAIAGYVSIAMTDADYTLTVANGATDQARRMMLNMTGTLSAARNVICPTASKLYVIKNATTGGFAITLKTSGGTGISIPNGQSMLLMCDGTNVVDAVTQFSSGAFTNLSYTGTLTGGTGVVALGTNQFYKDASGNVGIGTTGPSGYGKLAVVGNVGVTTDGTTVMTLRSNAAVTTIGSFNNASGSTLVFNTNTAGFGEAERMRLDASGNLGLGVTPTYKLDVYNAGFTAAQIASNSTSETQLRFATNTAARISNQANTALIFDTNATERMRLDSSGNLGIGTSSPQAALHVSYASQSGLRLANTTTSNESDWILQTLNGGSLRWYSYTASAERMRIDSSGNLGLGVTPSAWGSGIKAIDAASGGASFYGSTVDAGMVANTYYNNSNWIYKTSNPSVRYQQLIGTGAHAWFIAPSGTAGNAITFTQAMTLDASGNLGIGTSSPGTRLDISGVGATIRVVSTTTAGAQLYLQDSNSVGNPAVIASSGLSMLLQTNGQERARITSGGDLLVGTTASLSNGRLRVSQSGGASQGVIDFNHDAASGTRYLTVFYVQGVEKGSITSDGSTVAYNTSSDRRLKENIAPAADAGAVIDAIEVVQHDWKAGGHTRFGVIAQDLNAVAPEAVSAGDDGDEIERTWGVDYSKLVPMLIKEIQSLRARVAALEAN